MRLWYLVVAQVRSLLLRRRRQDELDEELRLHLDQETALRAFGGVATLFPARRAARAPTHWWRFAFVNIGPGARQQR